jgi:hypothetical protein
MVITFHHIPLFGILKYKYHIICVINIPSRCFKSDVNSGSSQENEEDTLLKEKNTLSGLLCDNIFVIHHRNDHPTFNAG